MQCCSFQENFLASKKQKKKGRVFKYSMNVYRLKIDTLQQWSSCILISVSYKVTLLSHTVVMGFFPRDIESLNKTPVSRGTLFPKRAGKGSIFWLYWSTMASLNLYNSYQQQEFDLQLLQGFESPGLSQSREVSFANLLLVHNVQQCFWIFLCLDTYLSNFIHRSRERWSFIRELQTVQRNFLVHEREIFSF